MIQLRALNRPITLGNLRVEPGQVFGTLYPDAANKLLRAGMAETYHPPPLMYIPSPPAEPIRRQTAATYETKVTVAEPIAPKRGRPGKATACKCGAMCESARVARQHCRKGGST